MVRQQACTPSANKCYGMSGVSNVMSRPKGSATKTPVSCPNIIKFYNNSMDVVDIMDKKPAAYRLHRKSRYRFYLRMFFDLADVPLVNSHIVYTKLGNDISLLNFKIVVEKALIGRYSHCKKLSPTSILDKRKSHEPSMPRKVPTHMFQFQEK